MANDPVKLRSDLGTCLSYFDRLARLYGHLKKRIFEERGILITDDWEQKVMGGAHDLPLPEQEYDCNHAPSSKRKPNTPVRCGYCGVRIEWLHGMWVERQQT